MAAQIPLPPTPGALRGITPSIAGISRRLSCGEHAQDILDEVVDFVIRDGMHDPLLATKCIALLADHGARIATDQPGCAMENLICIPTRSRPGLLLDLALALAGKPGELPFHVLAKRFPIQLSAEMLDRPAVKAGLRARDSLGRNVSHWLWDPDSAMVREIRNMRTSAQAEGLPATRDRDVKRWLSAVRNVWIVQEQLLAAGVSMELPDNHGCTAMDLCIERLDAGEAALRAEIPACKQVQVNQAKRAMDQQTPSAITHTAARPRL